MLLLLVVLLGAAAVCGRLGVWQLDRAELRGDAAASERRAELAAAPADPLADVLEPQTSFRAELVGQRVAVTGTYEADELLVPGRALDGRTGHLVLTPLRVDAPGSPVLAVVRGWVADRDDAAAAPAPSGPVRVTGYLQVGEAAGGSPGDGTSGAAPDEVEAISPAELVNRWGGPTYSGYLVLQESDPAQGDALATLPPPTLAGGGLNLQNLAYALQWWLFGGFAVLLWARLVRDETRAAREELAEADDVARNADDPATQVPAEAGEPAGPGRDETATAPTRVRSGAEADASP